MVLGCVFVNLFIEAILSLFFFMQTKPVYWCSLFTQ